MLLLSIVAGLSILISTAIGLLAWFFAKQSIIDREKSSPFECGFDPMNSARVPFSLRFFLLAVIFLIFDVEVVLLFPIVSSVSKSVEISLFLGSMIFIFIVLLGLFHEWKEGSLDWMSN